MKTCYKILVITAFFALNFGCAWPKKVVQSRDPFYGEEKKNVKKRDKEHTSIPQKTKSLSLEGIMEAGKSLAAVVHDGDEACVVVVGDHVCGYSVVAIESRAVVLTRGPQTKRLELD